MGACFESASDTTREWPWRDEGEARATVG